MIQGGLYEVNFSTYIYIVFSAIKTYLYYVGQKERNKDILIFSPIYAIASWFLLSLSHISFKEIEIMIGYFNHNVNARNNILWLTSLTVGTNLLSELVINKFTSITEKKENNNAGYLNFTFKGTLIYAVMVFGLASIFMIIFAVYPYFIY